jgi:hypothetical protein
MESAVSNRNEELVQNSPSRPLDATTMTDLVESSRVESDTIVTNFTVEHYKKFMISIPQSSSYNVNSYSAENPHVQTLSSHFQILRSVVTNLVHLRDLDPTFLITPFLQCIYRGITTGMVS